VIIGYSVEGSTDRALIKGLHMRWCPEAPLIEGAFRGATSLSLRREYSKICAEFTMKGVDVMVFLTDGNAQDWREVQRNERDHFPQARLGFAIHGVPDRNVECWICQDRVWIAGQLGVTRDSLEGEDPKSAFERAMDITRDDKKETEIAELVRQAPLHSWLLSVSFEDFYEQVRDASQRSECEIENLRDV
jgi:hypothetical protein